MGRNRGIRAAAALTLLGALTAVVGCSSTSGHASSSPSVALRPIPAPSRWPTAHKTGGVCAVSVTPPSVVSTDQLPGTAQSAELYWYEGFYSHTCRTYHSHLDATAATKVLRDLNAIPHRDPNMYACNLSFGKFVQIWFKITGGYVSFRIDLDGCAFYIPKNPLDLGPWPPFMPAPRT